MSKTNKERRKGEVIVFDPLEQELWCQDKEKLKRSKGESTVIYSCGDNCDIDVYPHRLCTIPQVTHTW